MSWRRALSMRVAAVAAVAAVFWLLAVPGLAAAHAALISTEPGQGAVTGTLPGLVSLTFSEPVVVAPGGVRVFRPDGAEIDNGHTGHLGAGSTVGVGLDTGRAQQGTYTVSWRVTSADSHPVAGAFTFSVGRPTAGRAPPASAGGSAAIGVSYAITRAVAFFCYASLVGSVAFVLLCWPAAIIRRGVRRVMLGGWAGLLATAVATLLLQGPYASGVGFARLFDPTILAETMASPLGTALIARLLLLALSGGCLVMLCAWLGRLRRRGRSWCAAAGLALALGLAATWAGADHASVGLQPAVALGADLVHLLAMGVWLGGLVTLVALFTSPDDPSGEGRAVQRFSSIATGAIVVLIGTGCYQSWRQLGSWSAFGTTDYGRLLAAKLGAVALMLGAAAVSHRWVTRRRELTGVGAAALVTEDGTGLDRTGLRRSVLTEAVLGGIVIGLTALLVNAEPARTATAAPAGLVRSSASYDTGSPGGQGRLEVTLDPATTGPNTIHIDVEDSTGALHDVAELGAELMLTGRALGPFSIPTRHTGLGRYEASGVQLPFPGDWDLMMTVRTSEIDETSVRMVIAIVR
ncbi:MAG TPA: copper resistance protein CopC [Pseudonocardiaceae bacterium]|nr:copper resistance protein CopC [Pseudonocardiaceae bacterium]